MKVGYAFAAAVAVMVATAIFVHLVMGFMARRNRGRHGQKSDGPQWRAEPLVALAALGVAVFLGWLALPAGASRTGTAGSPPGTAASNPTEPSSGPTGTPPSGPTGPSSEPSSTPPSRPAVYDVAEILDLTDRPPFADLKVKVSGLPSPGTRHLLVAEFNGNWQLKAEIPAKEDTHVLPADLSRADPGTWRNFYVVRANAAAVKAWEASKDRPLLALPAGTKPISGPKAHHKALATG
ncbi:hypothetical protein ACIBSW_40440 [Actinoplanes sp. NPDC049668]|uniref:hypothetical protein n=1 Tax=unclassified Actinoplanes TaxID=2626549 RepID=UPI0033A7A6A8